MTSEIAFDKENQAPHFASSQDRTTTAPRRSADPFQTRSNLETSTRVKLIDPVMEKIKAQVRQSRRESNDAKIKIALLEQELEALRTKHEQSLIEVEHEKVQFDEAVSFAEAEVVASKQACQELEREVQDLTDKLVTAGAQLDDVITERDSLKGQLETCRQELTDALKDLESAYDRALTEFEDWKRQHGLELSSCLSTEGAGPAEDSVIPEEEPAPSEDSSDGETYHFVRDEDVTVTSSVTQTAGESRPPFKRARKIGHRLRQLVTPSRMAVQLFAERELEDEYADHQQSLFEIVDEIASTPPDRIKRLTKLHAKLVDKMHLLRLTATKLEAVRSLRR
ncbi:hypothetical protein OIV83_000459 [Microbotryomycetes sp. JL201]|nr:hypothetical protein OIV83_000459 [Microbotryomycetes sp. JL201]